jgi:hypothetical protein
MGVIPALGKWVVSLLAPGSTRWGRRGRAGRGRRNGRCGILGERVCRSGSLQAVRAVARFTFAAVQALLERTDLRLFLGEASREFGFAFLGSLP